MRDKNLEDIYNYLEKIGYDDNDIEKILYESNLVTLKYSTLLKKIEQNYIFFISVGYRKEDVIKMTKLLPSLYGLSIENIKQKIEDLMLLGYRKEDVIKMTKLLPTLYSYSIENIKQKIEDLISLGYSKEDVIKMTKLLPSLFCLSIENMKQKIDDLISLGYDKEKVINMTQNLPSLYSYSIENIKQKIDFYKMINLDFIILEDTKKLMQSVDLTYARYMFFKDEDIEVTRDNYRRLFYTAKIFEKQYGIDKSTLLEKYSYQEYINLMNKNNSI